VKLQPVPIKKKCNKRGRKRGRVSENFHDLLYDTILPKWSTILQKKTNREGEPTCQVTDDCIWIKVLRDMKDFFRTTFTSRFHRSEKSDYSNKDMLIKIFLEELGITDISLINTASTFDFLYKSHYKARNTEERKGFDNMINKSPMIIYDIYNKATKISFLEDDLCSRLLYYFLVNFGKTYISCIQKSLRIRVMSIIDFVKYKY
jgi:hypothetical protein